MKKTYILFTILLLTSCKILKLVPQEKITLKNNRLSFELIENQMLVNNEINQKAVKLLFDTGAGPTVITDSTLITKESMENKISFGSANLPDGTKLNNTFVQANQENEMFYFEKHLVVPFFTSNFSKKCKPDSNIKGIMGMTAMNKLRKDLGELSLKFDFDTNTIVRLTADEVDESIKNYISINAKFIKRRYIEIELEINGKKDFYLFDTGNSAFDIITNAKNLSGMNPTIELKGLILQTIKGEVSESKSSIYKNTPIDLANEKEVATIFVNPLIKDNNIGLNFIKKFNWIVDYQNKKVYFKKRNYKADEISSKEYKQDYYVIVNDEDKLKVVLKKINKDKYAIGQEIISVNDTLINSENVCHYMNMLNKENWNDLKIEVK